MEVGGGGGSSALFSTLAADRYLLDSFSPLDAYLWALRAGTLIVWKTGGEKVGCALWMFVLYLEYECPRFYGRWVAIAAAPERYLEAVPFPFGDAFWTLETVDAFVTETVVFTGHKHCDTFVNKKLKHRAPFTHELVWAEV